MTRRRRNRERPVLDPFSPLQQRERQWEHGHEDDLSHRAELAMRDFKKELRAPTLKKIGEFKSSGARTRAQMKRTKRPNASEVRHIGVTPENEQEALRLLASCSKSHPLVGIKTAAADAGMHTVGRDQMQSAVRKQDDAVARTVTPSDEKPANPRAGLLIRGNDAGAPKQAGNG